MRGVKSSRALKCLILLVFLSLTLGWKVFARATREEQPTDRSIQVRVAEFLLVMKSPALGWDRDLVRRYANAEDQVFVVFRGRVYSDQPTFRTVLDTLWSRFLRELGFRVWPSPVLAVIARMSCEADRLPWDKFDPARS